MMKIKYFLAYLFLISIFLFNSCEVNDTDDNDYSQSVSENRITVFIKNGTLNASGVIKIANNSNQSVFIIKTLYPFCNFSNYNLAKIENFELENLTFDEYHNKWIKNENPDSIVIVCHEYRNPIEIKPYTIYKEKIANVYDSGEFQLRINYRFTEIYNPNSPDKKIFIKYIVN